MKETTYFDVSGKVAFGRKRFVYLSVLLVLIKAYRHVNVCIILDLCVQGGVCNNYNFIIYGYNNPSCVYLLTNEILSKEVITFCILLYYCIVGNIILLGAIFR